MSMTMTNFKMDGRPANKLHTKFYNNESLHSPGVICTRSKKTLVVSLNSSRKIVRVGNLCGFGT